MWVCAKKTQALASVEGLLYPVGALNDARTPVFVGREICTSWVPLPNPFSLTMTAEDIAAAYALGVVLVLLPWLFGYLPAALRRILQSTWGR